MKEKALVLYKDAEMTQPFTIEDIGDVDAGDIKFVEAWLRNDSSRDYVQIEPETFDEDIKVLDLPNQLGPNMWQLVTIRYAPKENRDTGLNTFISIWGKKRIPPE